MPDPAIKLSNLGKAFSRGKNRVEAVRSLDLEIEAQQVFGFLGPNGAGKTTTIRLLMDLIRPTSGTAHIYGQEVSKNPDVLQRVGALVEDARFYAHLNASDNLRVLAYTAGASDTGSIDSLLEQVGIADAADRRVSDYSTGMKQRLGIAAALLDDPDLVILDEPTNGLDPAGIVEMRKFIRSLVDAHGKTVFLSSHLLNEVEQTCDRVAIIDHGVIVREGNVRALLSQGGSELRVMADPIEKAAEVLQQRWDVTINEEWLSVAADEDESPEIVRALVAGDIDVRQVISHQQSLEEFFMSVTGRESTEDGDI